MIYRYLLFLLFCLPVFQTKASHIVGGEIYYDYLGNNNYRIFIAVFRDCASTGADFDDPLPLAIYNAGNVLVQQVNVPFPGSQVLPVVFNNPCVTPPAGICIERAIYQTVVNLPPSLSGYTVSYQRCCRGPNITFIPRSESKIRAVRANLGAYVTEGFDLQFAFDHVDDASGVRGAKMLAANGCGRRVLRNALLLQPLDQRLPLLTEGL